MGAQLGFVVVNVQECPHRVLYLTLFLLNPYKMPENKPQVYGCVVKSPFHYLRHSNGPYIRDIYLLAKGVRLRARARPSTSVDLYSIVSFHPSLKDLVVFLHTS